MDDRNCYFYIDPKTLSETERNLKLSEIIDEMTDEKKICLYFIVEHAITSDLYNRETSPVKIIYDCKDVYLDQISKHVKDVVSKFKPFESTATCFLINKALENKEIK